MTTLIIAWLYLVGLFATAWAVTENQGSVAGWPMAIAVLLWPITLPAAVVLGFTGGSMNLGRKKQRQA